jgi:hypothetical protein
MLMDIGVRRTVAIIVALAAAGSLLAAAWAAPETATRRPAHKPTTAAPTQRGPEQGTDAHTSTAPRGHAPTAIRISRGAASADAKRLGALVGKECTGRAEMPRNETQWIVLCSNGKTFVVQPAAAHQPAIAPVECSLAGTGPEPACFPEPAPPSSPGPAAPAQ